MKLKPVLLISFGFSILLICASSCVEKENPVETVGYAERIILLSREWQGDIKLYSISAAGDSTVDFVIPTYWNFETNGDICDLQNVPYGRWELLLDASTLWVRYSSSSPGDKYQITALDTIQLSMIETFPVSSGFKSVAIGNMKSVRLAR